MTQREIEKYTQREREIQGERLTVLKKKKKNKRRKRKLERDTHVDGDRVRQSEWGGVGWGESE